MSNNKINHLLFCRLLNKYIGCKNMILNLIEFTAFCSKRSEYLVEIAVSLFPLNLPCANRITTSQRKETGA